MNQNADSSDRQLLELSHGNREPMTTRAGLAGEDEERNGERQSASGTRHETNQGAPTTLHSGTDTEGVNNDAQEEETYTSRGPSMGENDSEHLHDVNTGHVNRSSADTEQQAAHHDGPADIHVETSTDNGASVASNGNEPNLGASVATNEIFEQNNGASVANHGSRESSPCTPDNPDGATVARERNYGASVATNGNSQQNNGASVANHGSGESVAHTTDNPDGASVARGIDHGASVAINESGTRNSGPVANPGNLVRRNGASVASNGNNEARRDITGSDSGLPDDPSIDAPNRRNNRRRRARRTTSRRGHAAANSRRGQYSDIDAIDGLINRLVRSLPYLESLTLNQIGSHTWSDQLVPIIWRTTADSSCDQMRLALRSHNRGVEALETVRG